MSLYSFRQLHYPSLCMLWKLAKANNISQDERIIEMRREMVIATIGR